jgi:hypothetical protein
VDFYRARISARYNRFFMKILPVLFLFGITVLAITGLSYTRQHSKTNSLPALKEKSNPSPEIKTMEKLDQKAAAARVFSSQKGYNANSCLLIDMSLPSGQNRFFIYDLKKDTLQAAGLVTHGNCFESWLEGRRYSNVVGSGCTSLGRYRIGNPYVGKFGYSYKLVGLDSTNNNAFERTVVLHGHACVPETESTDEICQSNGCPTLSPAMLLQLKKLINQSGKPVLLWIYE